MFLCHEILRKHFEKHSFECKDNSSLFTLVHFYFCFDLFCLFTFVLFYFCFDLFVCLLLFFSTSVSIYLNVYFRSFLLLFRSICLFTFVLFYLCFDLFVFHSQLFVDPAGPNEQVQLNVRSLNYSARTINYLRLFDVQNINKTIIESLKSRT